MPTRQTTLKTIIPAGEALKSFTPTGLAWQVLNLVKGVEGTLRSVRGPCPYEQNPQVSYGAFHGVYHTGAPRDFLITRTGTQLRRHAGWARNYEVLVSGLSDDANQRFPDQWATINGLVIWTNGVDRAIIAEPDGTVSRLGYSRRPSAPAVESPTKLDGDNTTRVSLYANGDGYSYHGRIGTVGDEISQVEGKLLAGSWYYYAQYVDNYGNKSPLSAVSNAASVYPQSVVVDPGNDQYEQMDDLTRQFLVRLTGDAPAHTAYVDLYRTPDTRNLGTEVRWLARIPGRYETLYPDNKPDSELGPIAVNVLGVPVFKVMTTHQGRLVIANTHSEPGAVFISDIAQPGTYRPSHKIVPDSNGAEVTAVFSFEDNLLAFTENSIYLIVVTDEGVLSRPLFEGVGCAAPSSIQTTRDGTLMWLSTAGFYGLKAGTPELLSKNIDETIHERINRPRMAQAVATIEPITNTYMCAVAPSGKTRQELILCLDEDGWRELDLGIHVKCICTMKDQRGYVLMGGRDGSDNNLFVFDHEYSSYTPPDRTYRYRSGWMRTDEVGLSPFRVRMLYLKMVRAWHGNAIVRFFIDNKWSVVGEEQAISLMDRWGNENLNQADAAVIGNDKVVRSPEYWRKVSTPPELDTCFSFAFEIECEHPVRMKLNAIAFDVAPVGQGQALARIDGSE